MGTMGTTGMGVGRARCPQQCLGGSRGACAVHLDGLGSIAEQGLMRKKHTRGGDMLVGCVARLLVAHGMHTWYTSAAAPVNVELLKWPPTPAPPPTKALSWAMAAALLAVPGPPTPAATQTNKKKEKKRKKMKKSRKEKEKWIMCVAYAMGGA
jgi:hypothetical protein